MLKIGNLPLNIEGIYLFKANSGISLYSKTKYGIQEDMFSAFLSALKGFFSNLALGGLSSFSSDDYIIYLATSDNVLTALIVNNANKSDKYYTIGYQICKSFYENYKSIVNDNSPFWVPNKENFDIILEDLLANFDHSSSDIQRIVSIYNVDTNELLVPIEFINKAQLFSLDLFIVVNSITKKIYIIENSERNISSRLLYLANKASTTLNQKVYRSEFTIQHISDPMDFERIIGNISKILKNEIFNFNS